MTNLYILPETVKGELEHSSRICLPFTLQAIMRVFLLGNFHCKRMLQKRGFICTDEGHFSSGNGTVRGIG